MRIGVRKAVPVDFRAAPVHGKSSRGRRGVFSAIVAGVAYIMSKRLVELWGVGDERFCAGLGLLY